MTADILRISSIRCGEEPIKSVLTTRFINVRPVPVESSP